MNKESRERDLAHELTRLTITTGAPVVSFLTPAQTGTARWIVELRSHIRVFRLTLSEAEAMVQGIREGMLVGEVSA